MIKHIIAKMVKRQENKPEPTNLFAHPASMLSFIGAIVINGNTVVKDIAQEGFNVNNIVDLVTVTCLQLGITGSVYAADKNTYTPNGMWGRCKEDIPGVTFVDLNDNGIKDPGEPEIVPDSIDEYQDFY